MNYRVLGKTGLSVSTLSFGASSLGSGFRPVDEAEGIETVHLAVDLGMNFIDVSPYYGLTTAETILGKALKEISRDKYYLATKVGRYDLASFDFSADRVTRSVDESLSRLGIDYIDLIQCHDIEFGSIDQVVEETIPALERLRESGKVRFIGITGLPIKIFRDVLEKTEIDTILSYCRYSLNDTALVDLIPLLQERNVGIISASPLSMGLLTKRGAPDWHPAPTEIRDHCAKAAQWCEDRGADLAKLALQFALANEEIQSTLVGTASPENLKRNVAWIEEPIDQELLSEVEEILRPIKNATWPSGRPENN
jgi:aryl-alcohol dehydrogenase-like predicted oxidoreductase